MATLEEFKLIPLYRPEAVLAAWEEVQKGLEVLFEDPRYATDDPARVLNDILAGNALLWLGFVDGRYVGFTVTQIETAPTNPPVSNLWLRQSYKSPDYKGDLFSEVIPALKEFARRQGCSEIRFGTTRKGFERLMKPHGFEPTFTILTRRVE